MKNFTLFLSTLLFSFKADAYTIQLSSSRLLADISVYVSDLSLVADAEVCIGDDFTDEDAVAAFIELER